MRVLEWLRHPNATHNSPPIEHLAESTETKDAAHTVAEKTKDAVHNVSEKMKNAGR